MGKKSWRYFLRSNGLWTLVVALLVVGLILVWYWSRPQQTTYGFTDAEKSGYELSDGSQIEIADGTLQLTDKTTKQPSDAANTPYVITKEPVNYDKLEGFSEQPGPDNTGKPGYQLSENGRDWQYWNGQKWTTAEAGNYDQSNDAQEVDAHIDEYGQQTGPGDLYTQTLLPAPSGGGGGPSLSSFSVQFTPLAAGTNIDSVSPATGTTDGGNIVTLSGSGFYSHGPYRTIVNILNNDVDLTDYQALLTIDTASLVAAGKMRADCADLRMLDGTGQNALPFWVDPNTINSPATKIWVRIPNLPSFTYTTVFVNYGNPLLASASSAAATFPKQLTGAQAVWPMEENVHGSFIDYSGNNNSYGSTSSSGKVITGKYGLGRSFDASQGVVPIPNSTTLRPTTALTLESWVYPVATTGTMPIINAISGTNSYSWELDATNKLILKIYLNGVLQTLTTTTGLPINTWSHAAATYDSTNGQMKIYVNGTEVVSQTVTPYPMTQPAAVVNIGGNSHATNIDELRIYNRVLSPSEITDSYNSQGVTLASTPNTVMLGKKQGSTDITVDIEDAADINVKIGGQTARIVGKTSTGSIKVQAPPHAAGAVDVTVTNPDGTNATLTGGYTYAADVKTAPSGSAPNPNGGKPAGGTQVSIPGSNIYKLGQYRRQITLNNPSNMSQADYQVKVTMDTTAAVAAGRMKADGSDIRIADSDKSSSLNYWIEPGTINTANTTIWVRVPFISYSQSKTLWMTYGNSVNPANSNPDITFIRSIPNDQGMWSMDEASGTSVADASGSGLVGTSSTAANIVPGIFGNGRSVGAPNVSIPHSAALKPTGTAYSVEAWVKPTAYGTQANIVAADTGYLTLNTQSSGCLSAQFCFWLNGKSFTPSNAPALLNTWYHVVGTYDGTAVKIYINGVLRNSRAATGNITASSTNRECFGWNTNNGSSCANTNPFTGSVDEVRIYDKSLAAGEVADLYNNYGYATSAQPRTVLVGKRPAAAVTTASVAGEEAYSPTVTFGGVPATNVTVTDTGLSVTAPAHAAGSVDVVVTNPDGQSFTMPSSYLYAGTPVINTVAPNRVSSVGGDTITISGSNFRSPPEVKIGGVVAGSVTVVNGSTLQVATPPHAPGLVDIVVTNPDGQTVTSSRSLTYLGNAPALYGASPNNGPSQGGTVVTLNGANFNTLGGYRLPVTVTNSGAALTDYQIQLSIDTASLISAGKMRYDAGDLRVDFDGLTPLSFWIDASTVGTSDTKVWVKVPSLPPGDTTLNITYGNPALTSASNSAATFTRTIPNTKAYFSLDESSASAAADSMGTVGAPASITSATVVPGKFGNARSFTGAGRIQYTTVPAIRPTTAVTLETWVNFTTIKAQDIVGSVLSSANQSLFMDAGGLINFQVYTGAMRIITAPSVPSTGTWHHVAGTYDSATGVQSLYVDGVLAASQTTTGSIVVSSSSYLCLSGNPTGNCASNNLAGSLDEVRVYDRAVSAAEVADLAGGYAMVVSGTPYTMAVVQPRASGLSITNGSEVQGDLQVTIGGVVAPLLEKPTSSSLKVIAPAHAVGKVDVQVTNPDNQTTTLANSFTYTSGIAVNGVTPSRGGAAGGTNVTIVGSGFFAGGTFRTPVTVTNSSGANVSDYQVPLTVDTAALIAAGKMKADGSDIRILDSDGVTSLSYWIAPGTINTASTEIWLRIPFILAGSSRTISMSYGNPAASPVSNQATTFRKVIPGVQGEWHMDEASGTNVADSSGNGFAGTASAAATATSGGRFGNARLFDNSTTSAVSVTSNTTLRPTAAVAAEAWFFAKDPSLSQNIVTTLGAGIGYGITLNYATGDATCDSSLCFAVGVSSTMKGVGIPSSTLKANTWYHVVGTYDGVALKLYLNGAEVASRAQTGAISQSTLPVCIGMRAAATCTTTSVFKGVIDEVRLYNRALAADEVASLYNGYGLASTTQPRTVLVGTPKASGVTVAPNASEVFGGSVTFGGNAATNIGGTSTNLTATTPPHPLGEVDVKVTNPGGASVTLTNGYKYTVYGYKFLNSPLNLRQGEPGTLTVQPIDEFGNPVTTNEDITISLGTSSAAGFFARDLNEDPSTRWTYDSVVLPAGASQAVVYYKDNAKGSPVVTANGPAGDGSLAASQTEKIASEYRLLVTGISSPIQSGIPSSVTVQAVDYAGQPLPNYNGTIHFTSTDTGAVTPPDFAYTTDLLGRKTFVNGVTMVTQGAWCVTATDASDPDITGSQCSINVTSPGNGAPAKLKFITAPQILTPSATSAVMTVQSQDVNNAPAPFGANTPVYLYSNSPSGEFSTDGVNWIASGQPVTLRAGTTSVNFYHRDSAFGNHQLTARDDSGTGSDFGITNGTQNVSINSGSPYRLSVLPPPAPLTAGASSDAFQVILQDQFGNPAFSAGGLSVWVTSDSASGRFSPDSGFASPAVELALTIPPGGNAASFYYKDTNAGARLIAASDSSPPNGALGLVDASTSVNVQPAPPAAIEFTSAPQSVVAGAVSGVMSVRLVDTNGNPTNATSNTTLYLSATAAGAQFLATDGTTAITQVVIPAGQSSASFRFKQNTFTPLPTVVVSDNSPADGTAGLDDASQQQVVTTGGAAKLVITSAAPPATAAGTIHTLRVELQNANGVAVPSNGATTLFARSTSAGSSFSATASPWAPVTTLILPDGQDHLDVYYQDTLVNTATVTIADEPSGPDNSLTNATQVIQTVAAAAGRLHITSAPKTLSAGQVSGAITVRLEDPYGNPVVAAQDTSFDLTTSSAAGRFDIGAGGAFDGSVTGAIIRAGQSTVNIFYKDLQAGTPLITAATAGLTSATQTETINWGAVTILTLGTVPPVVAGQPSPAITVSARNAYNTPVQLPVDLVVNLSTTGTTGRFDASAGGSFDGSLTSITIPAGQSDGAFYYSDTKSGNHTLTATAGSANGTRVVQIIAADPAKLVISTAAQDLEVGERSNPITVQLQDQFGNLAKALSDTTVNFSSTSPSGRFVNSSKVDIPNVVIPAGQSSANFYYLDKTIGTPTISLSAAGLTGVSQTQDITSGNPTKFSLTADKASIDPGEVVKMTVYALNASSEPVPVPADVPVNLVTTSSAGRFDSAAGGAFDGSMTSVIIPSGQQSAEFYYKDVAAGSPTVSAHQSGYTQGNYTFNITASALERVAFTNVAQSTTAGVKSVAHTLRLQDQYGNVIAAPADRTITVHDSEASAKLSATLGGTFNTGDLQLSMTAGLSSVNFHYQDTVAGVKTLTAGSAGLTDGTQTTTVTPAAFHHIGFTTSQQTITAQTSSGPITITGYDLYNNQRTIAAGSTLVLNLTSGSPGGVFSLAAVPWQPTGQISIPNDTPQATFYYRDSVLGSTVMTVDDSGSVVAPTTQPISVVAGTVYGIHFSSAPQTVIKNTPSPPISVELTDQFGYTTTSAQPISVHLTSDSPTGQFSPDGVGGWAATLDIDYASGQSSANLYYRDSTEGGFVLEAASDSLVTGSQIISIVPGEIAKVAAVVATPVTAGQPAAMTLSTLTDDDQPAGVAQPTTIDLTSDSGGEFSLDDTNWQSITSVVIPAGHYTVQVFYRNLAAGPDTIHAVPPGTTSWQAADVPVTVGAAAYTTLAFQSLPSAVPAGSASGAIVIQARDQFGNMVLPSSDQTLYLYGPATGQFANNTGGPWTLNSITMPGGTGTATFYYQDTLPGVQKTLTVSDQTPLDAPDAAIVNAVGKISVTSPPPSKLAVTYTGPNVVAGERSGAVTIEARQSDNSPAVLANNLVVDLTSSVPGGRYFDSTNGAALPITQVTIPAGQSNATVYFSSDKSGVITLTAGSAGLTSGQGSMTFVGAAPAQLQFMTLPQMQAAGADSSLIRVQLQDRFGNPAVSGSQFALELQTDSVSGEFSVNPGAGWSPVTAITVAPGSSDAYFYYKDTAIGSWHLQVSASSLAGVTGAQQSYDVQAGTAARLVFTSPSPTLAAGQISGPLAVTLTDAFGNVTTPGANITLHLGSTSTGGRFSTSAGFGSTTSTVTFPVGQQSVNFFYKDMQVGSPTITASDLPLPDAPDAGLSNATLGATINSGTPTALELTGPATLVAGVPVAYTATIKNQYDALAPADQDLTLQLAGPGEFSLTNFGAVVQSAVIPAGQSSITLYYRDTLPGPGTLTAADNALPGLDTGLANGTVNVTVLPGNLMRLHFVSAAPNLGAGQVSGALTILAQDQFGNVVPVNTDLAVYLSSSSGGGKFSLDDTFAATVSQVTIPNGGSSAAVYYRDITPGTPTITASDLPAPDSPDQALINATLNATINAGALTHLAWSGWPPSAEAGQVVGPVTIAAQNQYDVALPVSSDLTVQLAHTDPGSGFATSPAGPWNLTSATIPAGSPSVQLYYRAIAPASDVLTAADNAPAGPDTGLMDAVHTLPVGSGVPAYIVITTVPYTTAARHTSPQLGIEIRNQFGGVAPVSADTRIYLRTTSGGGEFASNPAGPWGLSYITVPTGQSSASFYYRDANVGSPVITATDNLPPTPDSGLTNATQTETITPQTVDHFLVTNITTPQIQGTPSSVVVIAEDSAGYVVTDYAGTITFSSNEPGATLPPDYTFNPATDKGIHTFTNAVSFPTSGIKTVTVTGGGVVGEQTDIVVNDNPAGPITGLRFVGLPSPFEIGRLAASQPLALESFDSLGQPSNAPTGGFPVRLTSSSAGGEFALSPAGPWSAELVTAIGEGVSAQTVYYRDSVVGTPTITASDWIGNNDDSGLQNATASPTIVESFHFAVNAPPSVTAGQSFTVTINTLDQNGDAVTSYDGDKVVNFSGAANAPNGQVPLYPADVHFTDGVGTAAVTLYNAETLTLSAQEGQLIGTADIVVDPAAADSVAVTAPGVATAGQQFAVTVEAKDAYGNRATGFTGTQPFSWNGASNSPNGTPPVYSSSVDFAGGLGSAPVTLYDREVITLQATSGAITGTSGLISVIETAAQTIAQVSGDHQSGPVSQLLPQPLVVVVTDAYGNTVPAHTVTFAVTSGGGNLLAGSAMTGTDGRAQADWVLGPTPGTDNNTVEATAAGLNGSPVPFTASAEAQGFVITTPNPVTAGEPFTAQIKLVDVNGTTVTGFTGTKLLNFSGPSTGPGGQAPQYPAQVEFVNGVAQPEPTITLVAAETTNLTADDGTYSGTALPFVVRAGPVVKLATISPPHQVQVDDASGPITLCAQDQFGNATVAVQKHVLDMVTTSATGQFAPSPTGPWNSGEISIGVGEGCINLYYRDSTAGTFTLTFGSQGLVEVTQAINVVPKPPEPPEPEPEPGPGPTPAPEPAPSPSPGGGTAQPSGSAPQPTAITVYSQQPTVPSSIPTDSPTVAVPLPAVTFPVITSPTPNTVITPISGDIIVSGLGPPLQTVRIKSSNAVLASATTDQYGNWIVHIARDKFRGRQQTIYAESGDAQARSPSVTFFIKSETIPERIVRWWSQ